MLEVRVSTIQRRRREFGLSDEFDRYSDITDDELDQIHASVTGNSREGPPAQPLYGKEKPWFTNSKMESK